MKVVLVYFNTASRGAFPLGLSSLATYIAGEGHEVEVFDTTFYKNFYEQKRDHNREKFGFYKKIENPVTIDYLASDLAEDLFEKIKDFKPDIIGLSILSAHYYFSLDISKLIKQHYPEIPIIVGGLHPTLAPEETINNNTFDMICLGEGEYSFSELLKRMDNQQEIIDIPGIWIKQDGKIIKNEMGPVPDLDSLPIVNWDFFSRQHLHNPLDGHMYRIGSVEFSRGCPFSCNYCAINTLRDMCGGKDYLRRKSVDQSIAQLVHLKKKYDLDMFYFLDETFLSTNLKSLEAFSSAYKREVGIPFYGMTHPLSVTDEKVRLLKEMDCYLMTMGIEHGNEQFRKKTLNRKGSNKAIMNAFETFRRHGIYASAFGMLGLPYETRDMTFETVDLFRQCKPRTYAVGIFKPYLGSRLRELSIKEGFFDSANDDYMYPDTTTVLDMPQFPREEIEKLYKTFYLYTKVPREKFRLVKQAETDDDILAELVGEYR